MRMAAREAVARFGRRLRSEGLVQWTAGNVSCRVRGEPSLLAMTPTDVPYDELDASDVCLVRTDGTLVEGPPPTTELPLHTLVYARRPEVGAIVHTHSAVAMTMAALGWTLPPILTGLVDATGGDVATAPYARPGTPAMADAVAAVLADRGACFLRHHGLLAIGSDLHRAFKAAAVTEASADVYLRARAFGAVPELPAAEVDWIAGAWRSQWSPDRVATTRG